LSIIGATIRFFDQKIGKLLSILDQEERIEKTNITVIGLFLAVMLSVIRRK
jgi:hypothetical protein